MQKKSLKIGIFFTFIIIIFFLLFESLLQNNNNSPKISVIIPCYNSSFFLKDIFKMFENQTLKDYEIIFVDDGSTDNTKDLINKQKTKDDRIKLIPLNRNIGAGNARNVGLKHAIGDYVIFLDSDDIFYPDLLKTGYDLAKKHNVDILFFDFDCINTEDQTDCKNWRNYIWYDSAPINKTFSQKDVKCSLFTFSRGIIWNKVYKRKFLIKNNLYFLNIPRHNDSFFANTSYVMAKRMYITDKVLLKYRYKNKNSITVTQKNKSKEFQDINIIKLKEFLKDKQLFDDYRESFNKLLIHF